MRLPITIVAAIYAFVAHAAYLAPWNPGGHGASVVVAGGCYNVRQIFKTFMRMANDSSEFILNAVLTQKEV